MDWHATVSPPNPNPAAFGAGSLAMVQLCTPGVTYTAFNGGPNGGASYYFSLNGHEGLDGVFPYPWTTGAPNYYGGDSPALGLTQSLQPLVYSGSVKDQFKDWLMYSPPGGGQAVPLGYFAWGTNGNAYIPTTNNWANYGTMSAGAVTPKGTTKFVPTNSFPSWTQVIKVADGYYISN